MTSVKTFENSPEVTSLNIEDIVPCMVGQYTVRVNRHITWENILALLDARYPLASNVTESPTAGAIPLADENGTLDDWVTPVLGVVPGMVMMYGGVTAPSGWLNCDGASYLRADYNDLYLIIGTTYGAADGTHFNVPDLRGRVPMGTGTGTGDGANGTGLPTGGSALTARSLGDWMGAEGHTLTSAEMPAHGHTIPKDNGSGSGGYAAMLRAVSGTVTTGNTGSGNSHNNLQPAQVLNFIIKT